MNRRKKLRYRACTISDHQGAIYVRRAQKVDKNIKMILYHIVIKRAE